MIQAYIVHVYVKYIPVYICKIIIRRKEITSETQSREVSAVIGVAIIISE